MKIVIISVIRNEADVVEVFVRHHAEFADEILITDHQSCDDSKEILAELQAEGLPLSVQHCTDVAFDQMKMMTGLLREAARARAADWIMPLDADEFLTSDADPTVRPVLEAQTAESILTVPWRTYIPGAGDKPDEAHLHQRIIHRRANEGLVHSKVLVPGELARRRDLTIWYGSHHVRARRRLKLRRLDARPAEDLVLAHFPVRSAAQISMRALSAWPVRLARGASPEKHWGLHGLFRRIADGEKFHAEDLHALAAEYGQRSGDGRSGEEVAVVEDPVRSSGSYSLTRPGQAPADPQVTSADLLERFAEELGRQARTTRTGLLAKILGKKKGL